MVEIFVYAFGIMYTPGPVNLLSLNAGLNGQVSSTLHFCVGVGLAMLLLFLLFGYTGAWLINPNYQLLISLAGSMYIAYLAWQIASSSLTAQVSVEDKATKDKTGTLNFRSGLFMQLLNPKSFVAILPIATIQFPQAQITGMSIGIWSFALASLAFGAPAVYLLMGARLGKLIHHPHYFRLLNLGMALLLVYVAGDIAYNHVYIKWL
jgi:threonine/homoserine/homoserine lactone efflux protein